MDCWVKGNFINLVWNNVCNKFSVICSFLLVRHMWYILFFQQKYGVGLSRYVAELACFLLCDEIRYKKADQLRRDESHTQLFSYHSISLVFHLQRLNLLLRVRLQNYIASSWLDYLIAKMGNRRKHVAWLGPEAAKSSYQHLKCSLDVG